MNGPHQDDIGQESYSATYCPEDDKLRLYTGRVERPTYDWLRALGFTSTPKQECDFVAVWTPAREDAALQLIAEGDDIGDEDQSPEDRAADRAERFSDYRDKRRSEANANADRYEAGPDAYGAQSAARAERLAAKRDRIGGRAVTCWGKAEYWQQRTAGVIRHALYKSAAKVRRSRILRLESELRKCETQLQAAQERYDAWTVVPTLAGADAALTRDESGDIINPTAALSAAYRLANSDHGYNYVHPRTGAKSSLYSLMTGDDPITAREAAALAIGGRSRPTAGRWEKHLMLRLDYERQMLDAAGGTAGDADMELGGFFGGMLIVKVNRSNTTGQVVSVNVHAPKREGDGWDYRRRGDTLMLNVQRSGLAAYTQPTEESRAQVAEILRKATAATKARNAVAPKLINPTNEDAERLQAALNQLAYEARRKGEGKYTTSEQMRPTSVAYMTQAEYTARSKGAHARYETVNLHAGPLLDRGTMWRGKLPPILCKLRIGPRQHFTRPSSTVGVLNVVGHSEASAVVVITDKPQKPLPGWSTVEQSASVQTIQEAQA